MYKNYLHRILSTVPMVGRIVLLLLLPNRGQYIYIFFTISVAVEEEIAASCRK